MSDEKKYVDLGVKMKGVSGFTVKRPKMTAVQVALIHEGEEVKLSTYHPHDLEQVVPRFCEDGSVLMLAEGLDFGFSAEPLVCEAWGLKARGAFFLVQRFPQKVLFDGELKLAQLSVFKTQVLG